MILLSVSTTNLIKALCYGEYESINLPFLPLINSQANSCNIPANYNTIALNANVTAYYATRLK